jgi:hypothetical protein
VCIRGASATRLVIMLAREDFEAEKRQVCASGPPSDGDNLLGMEIDCCAYFGDPAYADDDADLWRDMEVSRSEGAEWLINGRARAKPENLKLIAEELSRIWEEKLRYHYRSAHTIELSPGEVVLLAVTQIAPAALWVTARIRVLIDDGHV